MAAEFDIGRELGEVALLLPGAIRRARAAQATLGHCTRILRLAEEHARSPETDLPDLAVEREAVGLDEASLDEVVSESRLEDGVLRVPRAELLHRLMLEGVEDMIAALAPTGSPRTTARPWRPS
jgi:hypothetical protein